MHLAIRVGLVVLSLALLRWASIRSFELDRQGRAEFRTLELVFGWPGIGVMFAVALAAVAFTIAMRFPVTRGFRWGPAVWGVAVFLLTFHANLYWWWPEWGLLQREWLDPVTTLFGLDRVTFLDDPTVRWVLAALGGVGLGVATGRPRSVPRHARG